MTNMLSLPLDRVKPFLERSGNGRAGEAAEPTNRRRERDATPSR